MNHHEGMTVRTYTAVFAALVLLVAATVWLASLDLGALNLPLALAIACLKTFLVLAFFMHLWRSHHLKWFVAVAAFGFLAILIGGLLLDSMRR
jgi:cytochrome c oxidase subunit 4